MPTHFLLVLSGKFLTAVPFFFPNWSLSLNGSEHSQDLGSNLASLAPFPPICTSPLLEDSIVPDVILKFITI